MEDKNYSEAFENNEEVKSVAKKSVPASKIIIGVMAAVIVALVIALIVSLVGKGNGNNNTDNGNGKPDVSVGDDGYLIVDGEKTEHKVHTTDKITVSSDGHIIVNGVTTDYIANKNDVISVNSDGYVVVNGVKTEYKIHTKDEITINSDGYVVVNGVKTEIVADKDDEITVGADGYVVVNGVKTEYKIHTKDEITINSDGYVVVNGVKTEIVADKDDVISVDTDGYLIVNGVKTEYEIKNKNHAFGDWKLYNEDETDCEKKLYYRGCSDCSTIEWREGKYEDHSFKTVTTKPTCQAGGYDTKTCQNCGKVEVCNETPIADHDYSTEYTTDNSFHWFKCDGCDSITGKEEHTLSDDGSCSVCGEQIGPTEGVIYDISADGTYAEVIGYEGTATKVKIAESYNGVPVTSIYKEVFKEKNITSVIIPDSIKKIGDHAFYYCKSLTSVIIGNGVVSIGEYAFRECGLKTLTIGTSVTDIGDWAFAYCENLSEIYFNAIAMNDLSSRNYVFEAVGRETNDLKVIIGKNVTKIPAYLFCTYSSNSQYFAWIRSVEFEADSVCETIRSCAFKNCRYLEKITIPNSVTSIGSEAFYLCWEVESITIPNSTTRIGDKAFYYCEKLKTVVMNENVTDIGTDAFKLCDQLQYNEYENCKYLGNEDNPYIALITVSNSGYSKYNIHRDTKIISTSAFSACERMTTINFEGTKGEWAAIHKKTYTCTIYCVDGEIE